MQHTIDTPEYINNNLISLPHTINTPKYLKKVTTETAWTQPILTSNGTLGGNSFAVYCNTSETAFQQAYPAYYAVDGNPSTHCGFGVYNYEHIIIYNPVPIKISSVTIAKELAGGAYYRFSASNDNTSWTILQDEIRSDPKETITWNFPNNETSYKYFKLEGKSTHGGYIQIVNIQIEGTVKVETWSVGTSLDYDVIVPQVHSINTPKYLKKVTTETAWTQPILTSNGTLGGDKFACSAPYYSNFYPYFALDGTNIDGGKCWFVYNKTGDFIFYNPTPIKVTNLNITNRNAADPINVVPVGSGTVYGSNDGSSWTTLKSFTNSVSGSNQSWNIDLSNNSNAYKYYKIACIGSATVFTIGEITITATQKIETWTTGTSNDYDLIK